MSHGGSRGRGLSLQQREESSKVPSWELRQQLHHVLSAGIRAAAATPRSGIQRFQQPAALGHTVPAEQDVHGCRRQRRAACPSARSRWPAAGRQKLGVTVPSPKEQSTPQHEPASPALSSPATPPRAPSAHAAASFLPRRRPAARALQRGGVTPPSPPSETGSRGTSERWVTGTAEKPPATTPARAGLDQRHHLGTPLRATIALLLIHRQVSLLPARAHSHAASSSPCNGATTSRLIP